MPLVMLAAVNEEALTHLVELVLVVPDVLLLLGGRGLEVEVVPRPREDLPPGDHPPVLLLSPGVLTSLRLLTGARHAVTELKKENCKILICVEVEKKN